MITLAPHAEPERQRQRSLTGPASARLPAIRPQGFAIIEVLRAALATVQNGVAQLHQRRPPFAFADAFMRIMQAGGEGAGEPVAQELRINRPVR